MMLRVPDDYDANWCPDCGEPRGVCRCDELQDEIDENELWEDDPYPYLDDDDEPDFTLDDLEWDEHYPELSEDEERE